MADDRGTSAWEKFMDKLFPKAPQPPASQPSTPLGANPTKQEVEERVQQIEENYRRRQAQLIRMAAEVNVNLRLRGSVRRVHINARHSTHGQSG